MLDGGQAGRNEAGMMGTAFSIVGSEHCQIDGVDFCEMDVAIGAEKVIVDEVEDWAADSDWIVRVDGQVFLEFGRFPVKVFCYGVIVEGGQLESLMSELVFWGWMC